MFTIVCCVCFFSFFFFSFYCVCFVICCRHGEIKFIYIATRLKCFARSLEQQLYSLATNFRAFKKYHRVLFFFGSYCVSSRSVTVLLCSNIKEVLIFKDSKTLEVTSPPTHYQ